MSHTKNAGLALLRNLISFRSNSQMHSTFLRANRSITSKQSNNNRISQEEQQRASQLHSKLEGLMNKQTHSETGQEMRPMYKIFLSSLAKKKAEMINVGAALVCTLLAYQLVGLKIRSRKFEEELKLKKIELSERQEVLKSLTESVFLEHVSEKCNERLSTASSARIWSRSDKSHENISILKSIIREELQKRIGDASLSDEEKSNQVVTKLNEAREDLLMQTALQQQNTAENKDSILQEDLRVSSDKSGETVVKVTKFSI